MGPGPRENRSAFSPAHLTDGRHFPNVSERSQSRLVRFDETVVPGTTPGDLDYALTRRFLREEPAEKGVAEDAFNPQFNRKPLTEALEAAGIRYVFLGRELGGRSDDPACYEDGRIRYDRLAATEFFRKGLDRAVDGAARYRVALMCAEKEPLDCHRTLLVARALDEQGDDVAHIHADGRLEAHREAMDRLLDIHKLPREGDLSGTREEFIGTAIARQAQRVAYADDRLSARTTGSDS